MPAYCSPIRPAFCPVTACGQKASVVAHDIFGQVIGAYCPKHGAALVDNLNETHAKNVQRQETFAVNEEARRSARTTPGGNLGSTTNEGATP